MATIDQVAPDTTHPKSTKAKQALKVYVDLIDKELKKYFDNEISHSFGVSAKERKLATHIWKHIKEHNLRPAKRLRGSFVYFGYQLFSKDNLDSVLKASMCIELVHTALLMHDDIMDQDTKRRGLPTTHEYYKIYHSSNKYRFDANHYGTSMAINAGDIALLAGHQILIDSDFESTRKIEASNRLLRGIINTGFGQAYDIELEAMGNASNQDILDLHLAKTAIYTYENPLHIGAILAGAKKSDLDLLSQYAIPGGIAFQIQDDILGLFGNEEKTGKPANSDLKQGKITLLITQALKNGSPAQIKKLKQIWGNKNLTETDANKARKIVIDTGSLDYSKKVSIKWAKKAQATIPEMRKRKWNKEAVDYLDGIAQYMVEREV